MNTHSSSKWPVNKWSNRDPDLSKCYSSIIRYNTAIYDVPRTTKCVSYSNRTNDNAHGKGEQSSLCDKGIEYYLTGTSAISIGDNGQRGMRKCSRMLQKHFLLHDPGSY